MAGSTDFVKHAPDGATHANIRTTEFYDFSSVIPKVYSWATDQWVHNVFWDQEDMDGHIYNIKECRYIVPGELESVQW